jgi:serine/threonine protein kinase
MTEKTTTSSNLPQKIGRYQIKSELGRGGMSTVYRGYDPRFEREIAVKVLPHELLHDPMFRVRFEREAKTIAALEHAAIVPVYDFGEEGGQPYLVMRLMAGGTLSERLEQGPLALSEVARIVQRIGSALDEAHRQGVIHRDLKPGNVLFDKYGNPFLSDFGIVRLAESEATLTGKGTVGTPGYMSPEQIEGNMADNRSDIYALGVIVFEMITGQNPFAAESPAMVMVKQMTEALPDIQVLKPDLPAGYGEVIRRTLAVEREKRPDTAGRVVELITRAMQTPATDLPAAPTEAEPIPVPTTEVSLRPTEVVAPAEAQPGAGESVPASPRRPEHTTTAGSHLPCPNCGQAISLRDHGDVIRCGQCGRRYQLAGHMCPACNNYHERYTSVCSRCGEATTRLCSNCNASNWSGDEDCKECGTSLDILQYMRQHTPQARRERLREQSANASHLKEIEEAASQKRMAELMAIEEDRQAELRSRQQKQRAQDRLMLTVVFGIVGIVLIAVILYILLT